MENETKQRIIIFDSPDGTGKTNIAQGLCSRLNLPYFRCNKQHEFFKDEGSFRKALTYGDTLLTGFLEQTGASVVLDRAYPAEWVYSRAYGRATNLDLLDSIDRSFSRMDAWIIIPVRHDYSNAREDEVIENEMLPIIHREYVENFRYWTMCNTIVIYVDTFEDKLEWELNTLIPEIRSTKTAKLMIQIDKGGLDIETAMFHKNLRGDP